VSEESEKALEPTSAEALRTLFSTLHRDRLRRKAAIIERRRRRVLLPTQRLTVLAKTAGRCHICGGMIDEAWEADHVLAHSGGGAHLEDNYLPAHRLCNNYRWDYLAEEFQYILKLGVWARTQIEMDTRLGREVGGAFVGYEQRRRSRRRGTI
jgi:5-methylcytosine-specific restriction endonuclease McrA